MIETETPIDRILPIQYTLDEYRGVLRLIEADLHLLPRVTLVPHQDKESFILVDGHHRTVKYLFHGRVLVPSKVLETDEDVRECFDGALSDWELIPSNLRRVQRQYNCFWKREVNEKRIRSMRDLLNKYLQKRIPLR